MMPKYFEFESRIENYYAFVTLCIMTTRRCTSFRNRHTSSCLSITVVHARPIPGTPSCIRCEVGNYSWTFSIKITKFYKPSYLYATRLHKTVLLLRFVMPQSSYSFLWLMQFTINNTITITVLQTRVIINHSFVVIVISKSLSSISGMC